MTDTNATPNPSEPPESPEPPALRRRRRPIVIALGVMLVVAAGLIAWIWSRPVSPTATRDATLAGILSYGGPDGWTVVRDPDRTPAELATDAGAAPADPDGQPVLVGDDGFTVIWAVWPATPEACANLATWTGRRVDPKAEPDVTASCPDVVRAGAGGFGTISTYRTDPGENGRYVFVTWTGPYDGKTALFAGLTYQGATASR